MEHLMSPIKSAKFNDARTGARRKNHQEHTWVCLIDENGLVRGESMNYLVSGDVEGCENNLGMSLIDNLAAPLFKIFN